MLINMSKRKNIKKSIEESSSSSTPTDSKDNETNSFINQNNIIDYNDFFSFEDSNIYYKKILQIINTTVTKQNLSLK